MYGFVAGIQIDNAHPFQTMDKLSDLHKSNKLCNETFFCVRKAGPKSFNIIHGSYLNSKQIHKVDGIDHGIQNNVMM